MTDFIHAHTHSEEFVLSAHSVLHLLGDALSDTLKTLPFLFAAFLIIEFIEHHAQSRVNRIFTKCGKAGPVIGSLLGCIPQCGFSVLSANLYMGGIISMGTLTAVFLSTSDEALILLAAHRSAAGEILKLLAVKIVIAVISGYIIDIIIKLKKSGKKVVSDLCEHDRCGCEKHEGILFPAFVHTTKVFIFLLIITIILDFAVAVLGTQRLSSVLLSDSVFQPVLAAIIGFIPNCAASVLLTELYLDGALSFGSVIAGLCTSAGAGLLVLLREKSRIYDNLKIVAALFVFAAVPGTVLHLLNF